MFRAPQRQQRAWQLWWRASAWPQSACSRRAGGARLVCTRRRQCSAPLLRSHRGARRSRAAPAQRQTRRSVHPAAHAAAAERGGGCVLCAGARVHQRASLAHVAATALLRASAPRACRTHGASSMQRAVLLPSPAMSRTCVRIGEDATQTQTQAGSRTGCERRAFTVPSTPQAAPPPPLALPPALLLRPLRLAAAPAGLAGRAVRCRAALAR